MYAKTAIQATRNIISFEDVQKLGRRLQARFVQYENDRRLAELKWAKNARQVLGIYDPDIESKLDPNRSRAYPKLTRVKCVSMLSRIMNLLFQDSDKPWAVEASPVANLDKVDLDPILFAIDQKAQAEGREPTDEEIEAAIQELANKRAQRLEREIEDQLRELGGSRTLDYVALCRKVIMSGITYGMGILKGPFIADQKQRRWKRDPATGMLISQAFTAERPRYEFVPIWDYYPDMAAKTLEQMDGQFTRVVMSRAQVNALKQRPDFLVPMIERALEKIPNGNYKRRSFETDLRAMGPQQNVTEAERGKYEAIVWEGQVSGMELHAAGVDLTDEQRALEHRACIWQIDDVVIKAEIDPWTLLAGNEAPKMFHHFIFEEDESTLLGNGLPNIVRDSQMSLCAATRMSIDNGSIACGINLEVNTEFLSLNQDVTAVQPYKIWYREDANPATMQYPAVREIKFDSRLGELKVLSDTFLAFADMETFVGPATGGDMQKGPSEPLRTASGASMLRGDAALPFKDVVRNFDIFNQSLINSLLVFNKMFNKNPQLRGDFQAIARGATSLIAKEVLGIQLDNLAQTLTEEEKMYMDMHKFAEERVRVRDLASKGLVVSKDEATRRERVAQEERAAAADQQRRMVEAQIKEVLAGVLKDLSQAGKNSAAAEADTANVILAALEKGISPNALAQQVAGGGAPGAAAAAPGRSGGEGGEGAGGATPAGGEGSPGADAGSGAAEAQAGGPNAGAVAVPA